MGFQAAQAMPHDADGNPIQIVPLSIQVDNTGTYTYVGRADPGSATSAAVWQVSRTTNASGAVLWSNGDCQFNKIWDNRAGASYS